MTSQLYCDVADCDDGTGSPRPAFRNGKCSSHTKQLQRTGTTKTIQQKLPLMEQMQDVFQAYRDADSDADFERHRRHFISLAKTLGKREIGEVIREGLQRARASGKPIGRPLKSAREKVLDDFGKVLDLVGVVHAAEIAARLNGVSRRTVFRYLAVTKGKVLSSTPRPRLAG